MKLPVKVGETDSDDYLVCPCIVDADGEIVAWDDVAAALNATVEALDLEPLRRVVDTWRFIRDRYDRELEGYGAVQRAEYDVLLAALPLVPESKDGTP